MGVPEGASIRLSLLQLQGETEIEPIETYPQ